MSIFPQLFWHLKLFCLSFDDIYFFKFSKLVWLLLLFLWQNLTETWISFSDDLLKKKGFKQIWNIWVCVKNAESLFNSMCPKGHGFESPPEKKQQPNISLQHNIDEKNDNQIKMTIK